MIVLCKEIWLEVNMEEYIQNKINNLRQQLLSKNTNNDLQEVKPQNIDELFEIVAKMSKEGNVKSQWNDNNNSLGVHPTRGNDGVFSVEKGSDKFQVMQEYIAQCVRPKNLSVEELQQFTSEYSANRGNTIAFSGKEDKYEDVLNLEATRQILNQVGPGDYSGLDMVQLLELKKYAEKIGDKEIVERASNHLTNAINDSLGANVDEKKFQVKHKDLEATPYNVSKLKEISEFARETVGRIYAENFEENVQAVEEKKLLKNVDIDKIKDPNTLLFCVAVSKHHPDADNSKEVSSQAGAKMKKIIGQSNTSGRV